MLIVAHAFERRDFIAGHPALDFVNTVTARNTETPLDWLDGYARLLDWAALAEVAPQGGLTKLRGLAEASPQAASAALARARRLREALHALVSALAAGRTAPAHALETVEAAWKKAASRARLASHDAEVVLGSDVGASGLDYIGDSLALAAIDLLRNFAAGRTRVCSGQRCGWLFIDTSKGGRRVWCDMATCGNTAKSKRFQARKGRSVR
jgi:predicted RNA-binding Zn ribbon-like protein